MTNQESVFPAEDSSQPSDSPFITPPGDSVGESATTASPLLDGVDSLLTVPPNIQAAVQNSPHPTPPAVSAPRPLPPRVRRVSTQRKSDAFSDLLAFLDSIPETLPPRTSTFRVFGRRVPLTYRRQIARLAGLALLEHMSSWEFARVVQGGGYGLESYMETLRSIRDDTSQDPRDRMTAADKLVQLFGVFMQAAPSEQVPKPTSDSPTTLTQILVDIRGEGEASAETRLSEETGIRAVGDSDAGG